MKDFQIEVEDLSDGHAIHFDSLDTSDQFALVGLYCLQEHRAPNETEVIAEALCPDADEESAWCIQLFKALATGDVPDRDEAQDIVYQLQKKIVKTYAGIVQTEIDKILDMGQDDDLLYEHLKDRRMVG